MAKNKSAAPMDEDVRCTPSCGNVFADLGLPDPEICLAKANMVITLTNTARKKRLSRARFAKRVGMEPAQLERVVRGRTREVPIERIAQMLVRLGHDVDIVVRPKTGDKGDIRVRVEEA